MPNNDDVAALRGRVASQYERFSSTALFAHAQRPGYGVVVALEAVPAAGSHAHGDHIDVEVFVLVASCAEGGKSKGEGNGKSKSKVDGDGDGDGLNREADLLVRCAHGCVLSVTPLRSPATPTGALMVGGPSHFPGAGTCGSITYYGSSSDVSSPHFVSVAIHHHGEEWLFELFQVDRSGTHAVEPQTALGVASKKKRKAKPRSPALFTASPAVGPRSLLMSPADMVLRGYDQLAMLKVEDDTVTAVLADDSTIVLQQKWKLSGGAGKSSESAAKPGAGKASVDGSHEAGSKKDKRDKRRKQKQAKKKKHKRKAADDAESAQSLPQQSSSSSSSSSSSARKPTASGRGNDDEKLQLAESSLLARLKIGFQKLEELDHRLDKKMHLFADVMSLLRDISVGSSADRSLRRSGNLSVRRAKALGHLQTLVAAPPRENGGTSSEPRPHAAAVGAERGADEAWRRHCRVVSVSHHVVRAVDSSSSSRGDRTSLTTEARVMHVQCKLEFDCPSQDTSAVPQLPLAIGSRSSLCVLESVELLLAGLPAGAVQQVYGSARLAWDTPSRGPGSGRVLSASIAASATLDGQAYTAGCAGSVAHVRVLPSLSLGLRPEVRRGAPCGPHAAALEHACVDLGPPLPANAADVDASTPPLLPSHCDMCARCDDGHKLDLCITVEPSVGGGNVNLASVPRALQVLQPGVVFASECEEVLLHGGIVFRVVRPPEALCCLYAGRAGASRLGEVVHLLQSCLPEGATLSLDPTSPTALGALDEAIRKAYLECTLLLRASKSAAEVLDVQTKTDTAMLHLLQL